MNLIQVSFLFSLSMAFRQSNSEMKRSSASTRSAPVRVSESERSVSSPGSQATRSAAAKLSGKGAGKCQVDRIPHECDNGELRYTVAKSGICSATTDTRKVTVQMVGVREHEEVVLCCKCLVD